MSTLSFNSDLKRVLVIDGYAFRGLGPLYIIDKIVKSASFRAKKPLRPCDLFDLICGTSSGALIAILLGRLGLDCDTAITEYTHLVKACCGDDENQLWENILDNEKVKGWSYDAAVADVIARHSPSPDSTMLASVNGTTDHTRATAIVTGEEPLCFSRCYCIRSYGLKGPGTPPPPSHQWLIREAAHAALATPFYGYLPPLILGTKYDFKDSAFSGFNNTITISQREQKLIWPSETKFLTVSLGTDIYAKLVPDSVKRDWASWSITDLYCDQFINQILDKVKQPPTEAQRRTAIDVVRQIVTTAAETKGEHLKALDTLPAGSYHRIDPSLGLPQIVFADYFYKPTIKESIDRWAEDATGRANISGISSRLVEEKGEGFAEDLWKLTPPRPPAGIVNDGYNPQMDARRPQSVQEYLRSV